MITYKKEDNVKLMSLYGRLDTVQTLKTRRVSSGSILLFSRSTGHLEGRRWVGNIYHNGRDLEFKGTQSRGCRQDGVLSPVQPVSLINTYNQFQENELQVLRSAQMKKKYIHYIFQVLHSMNVQIWYYITKYICYIKLEAIEAIY